MEGMLCFICTHIAFISELFAKTHMPKRTVSIRTVSKRMWWNWQCQNAHAKTHVKMHRNYLLCVGLHMHFGTCVSAWTIWQCACYLVRFGTGRFGTVCFVDNYDNFSMTFVWYVKALSKSTHSFLHTWMLIWMLTFFPDIAVVSTMWTGSRQTEWQMQWSTTPRSSVKARPTAAASTRTRRLGAAI